MDIILCAEEGFYFEPLLSLLADFNKFMEAYQAAGDENVVFIDSEEVSRKNYK